MQGKFSIIIASLLVAGLLLFVVPLPSEGQTPSAGGPLPPAEGKRWRIGYCEGEPFVNFAGTLHGILGGLEDMGWIRGVDGLTFETGQANSREIWQQLATLDTGPYLEFVADAHYSFFPEPNSKAELLQRLKEQRDLDLVIVMGTYAGMTLASAQHEVPVLVFSSSNAVRSGIIESVADSGRANVWAHMDPGSYSRQVEVFYDLFNFSTLGLVHENSELGRIFSAVEDVEAVGEKRGFTVVRRFVSEPVDEHDVERYYQELHRVHAELAGEVDAFYITIASIEKERLEELLLPFYEKNVPVFSQLGTEEVEYGAVVSVARADFSGIGQFGAHIISEVLNGTKPQGLPQVYSFTPRIALNLEAAEHIGYRVPFEVLLVADEIYRTIRR